MRVVFASLLLLVLVACGQEGAFPDTIKKAEFTKDNTELLKQYSKIYGLNIHQADNSFSREKGKALIVDHGGDSYSVAFYKSDGEVFRRIDKPRKFDHIERPHASELLAKKVPCIVIKHKQEAKSTYLYIFKGKMEQDVL